MAMENEVERHRRGWIGFARFMRWSVIVVVVTLILMAMFLL